MAKAIYEGVSGVARKVKNTYEGIGGVARKIKAGWIGVGGVARQFFTSDDKLYLYNYGLVSPYTWSAAASSSSLQTDYMYIPGSSSYYKNPATFNMTAGNTNVISLDNYSKLVINAKSGSSNSTSHWISAYFNFSNGEYIYIGGHYLIPTSETTISLGRITPSDKTKFKNLYASYGAPTVKIQIYHINRSTSPRYKCAELYIYQVYFEPMPPKNSGLITRLTRSEHCSIGRDSNYFQVHSTYSGRDAYAYVYGNFSNKSYSFTVESSDSADDKAVWIEIYYKKTVDATTYTVKTLTCYSGTQTGTFPANTEYFRFHAGGSEDYTRDANVYSVIIDGVEYFDYLYWYGSWVSA